MLNVYRPLAAHVPRAGLGIHLLRLKPQHHYQATFAGANAVHEFASGQKTLRQTGGGHARVCGAIHTASRMARDFRQNLRHETACIQRTVLASELSPSRHPCGQQRRSSDACVADQGFARANSLFRKFGYALSE
jgi:hypothetical protein